jgi:ribosome modulation factor
MTDIVERLRRAECSYTDFELGYYAGLCGDDPRSCPYENMTKEWYNWQFAHRWGCVYMLEREKYIKKWKCPIDYPNCEKSCGEYGCGN